MKGIIGLEYNNAKIVLVFLELLFRLVKTTGSILLRPPVFL